MKTLFTFLVFIVIFLFFSLPKDLNEGFKLQNIEHTLVYNPEFESFPTLASQNKAQEILGQPLHYLCKGGQVYIFESKDKEWVIKFMKYHLLVPSFKSKAMAWMPYYGESLPDLVKKMQNKFDNLFYGYLKGYHGYPEHAALLTLHFNESRDVFGIGELIDKKGERHLIDLDKTAFIIQKKGQSLSEVITPLLKRGQVETASDYMREILVLYRRLYSKGLYDNDYGVMNNFGFLGTKTLHLDLGKLSVDTRMMDEETANKDLEKVKARMKKWVRNHFPEYEKRLDI